MIKIGVAGGVTFDFWQYSSAQTDQTGFELFTDWPVNNEVGRAVDSKQEIVHTQGYLHPDFLSATSAFCVVFMQLRVLEKLSKAKHDPWNVTKTVETISSNALDRYLWTIAWDGRYWPKAQKKKKLFCKYMALENVPVEDDDSWKSSGWVRHGPSVLGSLSIA